MVNFELGVLCQSCNRPDTSKPDDICRFCGEHTTLWVIQRESIFLGKGMSVRFEITPVRKYRP